MNKPSCRYIVKARAAYPKSDNDEIEFIAVEKVFQNESPIIAREEAFGYRNMILAGLFEGCGNNIDELGWDSHEYLFSNISEREIRKLVNPYLEPERETEKTIFREPDQEDIEIEWQPPDDSLAWYPIYNNGIWIIMEHEDVELHPEEGESIVIDKITKYEEPLPTPPLYSNLELEYKFYLKHNFDTKRYRTKALFFDDEEYLAGGTEEDNCYISFDFLKTPFDWSGYDKKNWGNMNSEDQDQGNSPFIYKELPVGIKEAFAKGENHYSEYKPNLINWKNSDRNIEYEIAIAISAFLNARGGYLFIGVADKKRRIIGLTFPDNSKDEFLREFTRIKTRFLPPYIAHTINGDFYLADNKEIFAITVYPASAPVFTKKKDENSKRILKEFYVRSDASSRHLYDIEEVVRYCRKRWT